MAPVDNIDKTTSPSPPAPSADDLEKLFGKLDEPEPESTIDPLSSMGYQQATNTDRQKEYDSVGAEAEKVKAPEQPVDQAQSRTSNIAEKFKAAQQKLSKRLNISGKPGVGGENATNSLAKDQIKREGKKVAKQLGKQAGRAIVRSAAGMLANPYVAIPLAIIIIILMIVVMILALNSSSGNTGAGPAAYPSSDEEKYAAKVTLAMSNDPVAKREVIIKEAEDLKKKLTAAKAAADKHYSTSAGEVKAELDRLIGKIDGIIAVANNTAQRTPLINELNEQLQLIADKYPKLFFVAGNCADLAPFIESKKFTVGDGPNADLIIKGQMMNKAGQVWPASQDLCRSLVAALNAGFTIHTNNFSYRHKRGTDSGNVSRHWCGAAIDINRINGEKPSPSSQETAKLAKFFHDAGSAKQLHIGELINPHPQHNMKNNKPTRYSSDLESSHRGHMHLSGRVEAKGCK